MYYNIKVGCLMTFQVSDYPKLLRYALPCIARDVHFKHMLDVPLQEVHKW